MKLMPMKKPVGTGLRFRANTIAEMFECLCHLNCTRNDTGHRISLLVKSNEFTSQQHQAAALRVTVKAMLNCRPQLSAHRTVFGQLRRKDLGEPATNKDCV